jgi:hypothetical protein
VAASVVGRALFAGNHGGRDVSRLVIGSTGEELVREAPCSLLLVPRPAEPAAADPPTDG